MTEQSLLTAVHGRAKLLSALQSARNLRQRAQVISETLRGFFSEAPVFVACELRDYQDEQLCVVDGAGKERPAWSDTVTALLHPDFGPTTRLRTTTQACPSAFEGCRFLRARIASGGRSWGAVALCTRFDSTDVIPQIEAILQVAADAIAMQLFRESCEADLDRLNQELAAERALADAGALAAPLAHAFNNYLNSMLLHVSALQADGPRAWRDELDDIRRQSCQIAAHVKAFQQGRNVGAAKVQTLDMNAIVADAVSELITRNADTSLPQQVMVRQILTSDLPPVRGTPSDLRRLVVCMLRHAIAATPRGGRVVVETKSEKGRAVVRVEDAGPAPPADQLGLLLELVDQSDSGRRVLELAACKLIVRRLHGSIRLEPHSKGGIVVTVDLPAADFA